MTFFKYDKQEVAARCLQRLSTYTNINQLAPGAKARFFVDNFTEEFGDLHTLFDTNLLQAFIQYADGKFLDFFGDMFARPRYEASHAESYTSDQNFMFYVATGTFGDINGGADFVISAGQVISTELFEGTAITPGIATQPSIEYIVTESIQCPANRSFAYGNIRARIEGAGAVVPRNVLTRHTFAGYSQAAKGLLKCINRHAISNGLDRETDEGYRYRLLNAFESSYMAVRIAIRIAALAVPGVSDVLEVNYEQGPGSYALYVESTTPTTSPAILREVSAAVDEVGSYGIRPYVVAPKPLGVELVVAVNWSPRATERNKSDGYIAMRDAVEDELNSLRIGEELDLVSIIQTMLKAAPQALSIGRNIINRLEEVFLYRVAPDGISVLRSGFIGDTVTPLYNEQIILETGSRYRGIQFLTS
jgi:uncharacterized phage protein gp47/JayE